LILVQRSYRLLLHTTVELRAVRNRRNYWVNTIEELVMTQNISKVWKLLKHLNNEKTQTKEHLNITPSQVAHNLIGNS